MSSSDKTEMLNVFFLKFPTHGGLLVMSNVSLSSLLLHAMFVT